MSDSLDQPAEMAEKASSPEEPQTDVQAQPAPVARSKARRRKAAAEKASSSAGEPPPEAGLPMIVAQTADPATGNEAAAGTALVRDVDPTLDNKAATGSGSAAERKPAAAANRSIPPWQPRTSFEDIWFRAAALAVALGIGWIIGANMFDQTANVHQVALQLASLNAKLADVAKAARIEPAAGLIALKSKVAALQRNVDNLAKGLSAQREGLAATRGDLESIRAGLQTQQASFEQARSDAAKLDRLAEQIDRVERQVSSLMPTGSISAVPKSPPAAIAARQTSSPSASRLHAPPTKAKRASAKRHKIPPNGYVLRGVRGGVAIVEDRTGLREVVPGEVLAGVGRVRSIERRGRRWVVRTSEGLIDSDPY